jgi:hypothetical protein
MPDSSDVRREIKDRLITTGVAASRAEVLRWALGHVREAGA